MLEGLEITEIKKSEVINHTLSFRTDAEFFKKEYLRGDKAITKNGYDKLVTITKKINVGYVGSMVEYYREDGIVLLQTKNIDAFFINDNNLIRVTTEFHQELKKSQINFEDILIARSGSFGKASIYLEKNTINSSDIILVEAAKESINPYFLVSYLNSKYGINQMIRFSSGGLQGHVNLRILQELQVPKIDKSLQTIIEQIIKQAYLKRCNAKATYNKAEAILLEEIDLHNFELSKESINVKSLKESFGVTKRLDAEYYQKKYEQVVEKIITQKHKSLSTIVEISKSIEPGSNHYSDEKGLPFYRVSDYDMFGLSKPDKELSVAFVADNKDLIEILKPKKGTILFSKDGSVGTAYLLREDLKGITSSAILHLQVRNTKEIIPEYLTLALNSKLVQMQAERDAGGSIILHWRKEEIEQVVVPIIIYKKQKRIAELVEDSFKLKVESERFLDVAKKAVEIAIEVNEKTAIKFINKNIN